MENYIERLQVIQDNVKLSPSVRERAKVFINKYKTRTPSITPEGDPTSLTSSLSMNQTLNQQTNHEQPTNHQASGKTR